MAEDTDIQWCDSTVNPTMGCDGCELWNKNRKTCYAGKIHDRWGGKNKGFSPTFDEITLHPGRMEKAARWSDLTGTRRPTKPWLNGLPRLIFVSDMSDALSKVVTLDYLEEQIINIVNSDLGRRHHWLWLTKLPNRMAKFSDWLSKKGIGWPHNLWPATSITTQQTTFRIKHLLNVGDDRTIRFLSVEPQWEQVDLSDWLPKLSWVIQGGESGPEAKPFHIEWVSDLIQQCRKNQVPYFLKQLGALVHRRDTRISFDDGHAGDWTEWPQKYRVRQFPISATKRRAVVSRKSQRRSVPTSSGYRLSDINSAKKLIEQVGSISRAKKLLDALG